MGIYVNQKICKAQECTLCLNACPRRVFGRFPVKMEKYRLSTDFSLEIVFPELCQKGCQECQDVCPQKAICISDDITTKDLANQFLLKVLYKHKLKVVTFLGRVLFYRMVKRSE